MWPAPSPAGLLEQLDAARVTAGLTPVCSVKSRAAAAVHTEPWNKGAWNRLIAVKT